MGDTTTLSKEQLIKLAPYQYAEIKTKIPFLIMSQMENFAQQWHLN